ncbi:molybdopterin-containing oxidoreductase family protein [Ramlibacter sp.]|uniref:molybdopterin-containing oxidoreductase family protein n=1 Tax=Ramlibacter sp. TaxID=1917967 RepID=UPI003D09E3DD
MNASLRPAPLRYASSPAGTSGTYPSICRQCSALCPIDVTVEAGRVVKVVGSRADTPYGGYSCPKGRALPEQHNDPARLLHPQKRVDGALARITSAQAVDEVARKIREIVDTHGPSAVAYYIGTGVVSSATGQAISRSVFRGLGSRMLFSAGALDKPAAHTSTALHGNWHAGPHRIEDADTWLVIGANPVISNSNGAPPNNPARILKERTEAGMKLLVIDPRRTETAKRAHVHLQIRPGEDPTVLAGLIHVILREKLYDEAFVAAHTEGFDELKRAVEAYTPEYVANRAGVAVDDLLEMARTFGRGRIGSTVCSTGPSFAGHSNLTFYLALCLNTLCGRWAKAGEKTAHPNVLLPAFTPKAQAYPPYPVFGKGVLSATGMRQNASGMPTAGLSDQILTDGPDKIRALFVVGGNPVLAWPDQARTERAMAELDLLVVFDYKETATTDHAHYVVPPPLSLEIPGNTQIVEWLKYIGVTRGYSVPWAQHTDAIVPPPAGSDLMEDGEFFFRLGQQLGLQLSVHFTAGFGPHVETRGRTFEFDMNGPPPNIDMLLEQVCAGSRVPLDEVRKYPQGRLFEEVAQVVQPADADCTARLQLGDPMMMADLGEVLEEGARAAPQAQGEFKLITRRVNNFMNSVGQGLPSLSKGRTAHPVQAHPDDMRGLSIAEGAPVRLRSKNGEVVTTVEYDDTLRRGTMSLTHGFAQASVQKLIDLDRCDPITGIPIMSGIPVRVEPVG